MAEEDKYNIEISFAIKDKTGFTLRQETVVVDGDTWNKAVDTVKEVEKFIKTRKVGLKDA